MTKFGLLITTHVICNLNNHIGSIKKTLLEAFTAVCRYEFAVERKTKNPHPTTLPIFSNTPLRSKSILNPESILPQVKRVVVVPVYTSTALHLHLYKEEPSSVCEIYSRVCGTSGVRQLPAHLMRRDLI